MVEGQGLRGVGCGGSLAGGIGEPRMSTLRELTRSKLRVPGLESWRAIEA